MRELLSNMIGRRVDVICSGAPGVRGEIVKMEGDVIHLKDEDGHIGYVAIDKIAFVWESRESEMRPGFVSTQSRPGFAPGQKK